MNEEERNGKYQGTKKRIVLDDGEVITVDDFGSEIMIEKTGDGVGVTALDENDIRRRIVRNSGTKPISFDIKDINEIAAFKIAANGNDTGGKQTAFLSFQGGGSAFVDN